MNPDTNRFEPLIDSKARELDRQHERMIEAAKKELHSYTNNVNQLLKDNEPKLLRPDGTEVPDHWTQFRIDEHVVIKDYTFKVAYIGETAILFEPVGQVLIDGK